MTNRIEIELPFWGFYESIHNSLIDDGVEIHFQDDNGDVPDEMSDAIWSALDNEDWKLIQREYCEHFIYAMSQELSVPSKYSVDLEFSDMTSPRYYNFETDRLFATIPADQLAMIRAEVEGYDKGERWRQHVKDVFTSYDGFSSNFPAELAGEEWTREDWSPVQYMPLFQLYLEEHIGEEWQYKLLDDIRVNEFASVQVAVEKIHKYIKETPNV